MPLRNEGWRSMSDSPTLSRLVGRPGLDAYLREPEEGSCEDLGCFGYLRGVRERAVMLELRKKNGNILAIGYSWIERIEFDPSSGIVLHSAGQRVSIAGRHLNGPEGATAKLFEAMTRHRVPWIHEVERVRELAAGGDVCVVDSILW